MNCIIRSAVLPAAPSPVGHSLFQSADGRIFALSTSDNTIQPGDTSINIAERTLDEIRSVQLCLKVSRSQFKKVLQENI